MGSLRVSYRSTESPTSLGLMSELRELYRLIGRRRVVWVEKPNHIMSKDAKRKVRERNYKG